MQGFMPGAAARHQCYLARLEVPTQHKRRSLSQAHDVGMRSAEAKQAFIHDVVDCVDQLFHGSLPAFGSLPPMILSDRALGILDQSRDFFSEFAQQSVELVV